MGEFLSDNVEWIILLVGYALERLQEIARRKRLAANKDVETDGNKVESKAKRVGKRVGGALLDLLPVVSRIVRRR